ncbi:alpha/beta hydrolase [Pseudomonadales bacterium]|nr:alpha/beta hydrolase [Pseudomonadales bacterium]
MTSVIKFFRNLKLLAIMVYSAMLGRAYLRKFEPETLCYCRSMGTERLLDIYRPKSEVKEALPTIVWFHGGAWKMGDRKAVERIAAEQLECGFALVSVSYSLSDVAQWPVQCHEAKAAIRFLRANAGALGLNPDRLIAAGMSAGAHMACILGVSSDHAQLNGELGEHLEESTEVMGVLALYPPTDFLSVSKDFDGLLDYYAEDSPVTQLLGESITRAPEKSNLASPLRRFTGACPPTLFLHGEADPIVPVEQSVILHETLLAAGVDSDLMCLAGYTHGDHRFNRGAPAERINAYLKNRATA